MVFTGEISVCAKKYWTNIVFNEDMKSQASLSKIPLVNTNGNMKGEAGNSLKLKAV